MGDSSPPRLRAPTPGAVALSPAVRATPIPPLRLPPRIVTVRPPPFRRDSSRTHRHALPLVKQLFASVAQTMMVGWAHAAICDVYIFEREGRGPLRCIAVQGFAPHTSHLQELAYPARTFPQRVFWPVSRDSYQRPASYAPE